MASVDTRAPSAAQPEVRAGEIQSALLARANCLRGTILLHNDDSDDLRGPAALQVVPGEAGAGEQAGVTSTSTTGILNEHANHGWVTQPNDLPHIQLPAWFLARGSKARAARESVREARRRITLHELTAWLAESNLTGQHLPTHFEKQGARGAGESLCQASSRKKLRKQ